MSVRSSSPISPSERPATEPARHLATVGLSEAEAARRLAAAGRARRAGTSRSYASIVRANVLTVFNLILAGFGTVTLIFGDPRDALFLGIIVANSTIGIVQEVRAKRALDRLSLLVAPSATVKRDGRTRPLPLEELVVDDVVLVQPGDQLIADGTLVSATDLRLDQSILTGESEPVGHGAGDAVLSGAFVVEGTGAYRVTAVREDSFAARVTGQARSFRHPRSPLERAINRLLYALVGLVVALGALLGYSLYHRHAPVHTAVATSAAGVVTLVPEGLMVLVSLTYAAAAVRMSRRGVLAQQLERDRVAGVGRHDLRRQDRDVDRVGIAGGRGGPVRQSDRAKADRGIGDARRRRVLAEPHAPGDRRRVSRGQSSGDRGGSVLQPPPVERDPGR